MSSEVINTIQETTPTPQETTPTPQETTPTPQETTPTPQETTPTPQVKLVEATISDQHMALNVIVGFIGVAQKRGCFALDESAKIYECIKMFQGKVDSN
jgi:hypothetical protein